MKRLISFWLFFMFLLPLAQSQYFGRNKPVYEQRDFKVTETEHFRIYEYLDNPEKKAELALAAEQWYAMHQAVLLDSFTRKNPIIIYNDHGGFQQTNVIDGAIGVGTGGVTEGLKNRVIFPMAGANQQTNHVLGHELVHAFQYKMILDGDSTSARNLSNLPLWMIEGLAEYLSIGRVDAHTAIWMRDAVLNDDVPRIRDLDRGNYFPYRWGQVFWAYISGVYGDESIRPFFLNTAIYGFDNAVQLTFGTSADSLSKAWQATIRNHFGRWAPKGKKEDMPGKLLISKENAGRMNICPVLSPNGKYLIFLSKKDLFSSDLYLAEVKTGKIIRKVAGTARDGHIDQFNFIESAGSWSPDSKRFVFDVYQGGRSTLVIKDVQKKRRVKKIQIPGVPAFSNPAWSPDGKEIVVSGLVHGQVDLYSYNLKTKKVKRLTNDRYSEILPSWSADGRLLTYSSDQISMERGRTNGAWKMNIAIMDMASGKAENLDIFAGADNINPQFDKNGDILFLSDRDGFRNLYRYDVGDKQVFQLSDLITGITGITAYSPAISVSEDRDRIVYTYYNKGAYAIYSARAQDFKETPVSEGSVDMVAATLPPFNPHKRDVVNTNLRLMDNTKAEIAANTTLTDKPYRPKFGLSYIGGSTGVGVMTGNNGFGNAAGLAGGIDMLFDDMLGNHQLYAGAALNGSDISNSAVQLSYLNRKNRIGWGVMGSHIPYTTLSNYAYLPLQPVDIGNGQTRLLDVEILEYNRLFQQRLGTFIFYPFSVTKRLELGLATEFYSQRTITEFYFYEPGTNFLYGTDRQRGPKGPGLTIYNTNVAYVGDNSYFGFTAPLSGYRYRVSAEQFFGDFNFSAFLLDGRKYFRLKPFTLAFRSLTYARVGKGATDLNVPFLYVNNPWFVRGYSSSALLQKDAILQNRLIGSKISVANAEIRLPLFGPKPLGLVRFIFPADVNLFFDAGVAVFDVQDLEKQSAFTGVVHQPVFSTGISFRINLFGLLILEPYYAMPLSAKESARQFYWGFNIIPGW